MPAPGDTLEIAPGLLWLRMPLPIDLNHINLWLVADGDGYTLFDSGFPVETCTQVWEQLETRLLAGRPIRSIVLTHFHPDHMGCAAWLQSRLGVPVRIARRALPMVELTVRGPDAALRAAAVEYFRAHGMTDAAEFFAGLPRHTSATPIHRIPDVAEPLEDGDVITIGARRFTAIEGDGHARGHQCFFDAGAALLISGDQILPTISPNISLPVQDWGADPLGAYLDSLARLEQLPAETLVLPAHGKPFTGLRARIRDLREHHEEHLAALRAHLATPRSAFESLPVLYGRRLRGFNLWLAMHECIAHLEHLVRRGAARRADSAGGGFRYVAVD